ncbi:hypothetical protein B0H14DRAFT_3171751 [Mycena olivaceomarginata]|nr:hypothetical protein B0H14DRAFT_3171751 [Mycena olivaceomarginata]
MYNITKIYPTACSRDEVSLRSEYSGEWAEDPEPMKSRHYHRRLFSIMELKYMGAKKHYRERLGPANESLRPTERGRAAWPDAASGSSGRHSGSSTEKSQTGWKETDTGCVMARFNRLCRGKLPIMVGSGGMKITHTHTE